MKKIVCASSVLRAKEIFSTLGEVIVQDDSNIDHALLQDKDALITRSQTKITSALLKNTSINFVGTATSGSDHVDINYLKANHITFCDAKGCNANAVANYVLSGMMSWVADNNKILKNLTVGIIGYGFVGKRLAALLQQQEVKVIISDQPLYDNDQLSEHIHLAALAKRADIISLHVPFNREGIYQTLNMINHDFLTKCANKPLIINTARGECIDYDALLTALNKQQISDFIADVWPNEPQIKKSYVDAAFLATPHIAGHTIEAKLRGSYQIYEALCKTWDVSQTVYWKDIINYLKELSTEFDIKALSQQMKKLSAHPKNFVEDYQNLRKAAGLRRET